MENAVGSIRNTASRSNIRHVGLSRPFDWLGHGWDDLVRNPVPSISHGLILVALGWLIIVVCSTQIELLALSVSGFLLVARWAARRRSLFFLGKSVLQQTAGLASQRASRVFPVAQTPA